MGTYNVSKIEGWLKDFTSAKDKFTNTYYSDYKNSYIRSCNDSAVVKMRNKLNEHYARISRINSRVKNVWDDFLWDLKVIDNRLAGGKGSANDSSVGSKLAKLPSLKEYKANLSVRINSASAVVGTVDKIGWSEDKNFWENLDNSMDVIESTAAVTATSVISGIYGLAEDLVDGALWLSTAAVTGAATLFGAEEWANNAQNTMMDAISYDVVGEANKAFYENTNLGRTINERSIIKYDSEVAQSIQNASTKVTEFAAATALTIATGGAAAPVAVLIIGGTGFLIGAGDKAQENFQQEDRNFWEDSKEVAIAGAVKAVEFYSEGQMGAGALKAIGTIRSAGGVKNLFSNMKTVLSNGESSLFTKESLKNGLKATLKDADTYMDSIGAAFNNITYDNKNGIQVNWKGLAKETACNFALNSVFGFIGNAFETKMISGMEKMGIDVKSPDVNSNGMKNTIEGINPKNVEVSSNVKKANVNDNLDALKKEYDELLNKSKESWFVKAKEASDNGWAWDLNKVSEADNIVKRMQELESTLGVKSTGIPESKIYDYSQAKKEADELARKISKEPIPGFENIDTNSQEYKKAMQEIYSKPSPSGKQDLSQIENPFNKKNIVKSTDDIKINKASNIESPKEFKIVQEITGGAAADNQVLKQVDDILKFDTDNIDKTIPNAYKNPRYQDTNFIKSQKDTKNIDLKPRNNNAKYLENLKVDDSKVRKQIFSLAKQFNVSEFEIQKVLDEKISSCVKNSDIGVRISSENLYNVLKTGEFKNQFQTGTTNGAKMLNMRTYVEETLFNAPETLSNADRPIYGMLFPKGNKEYIINGPNAKTYGDVVCIFKKENVINDTTLTCGDSLEYYNQLNAIEASNPKFKGAATKIFGFMDNLDELKNSEFEDIFNKGLGYFEAQLHGNASHSIDNLEKILFTSEPDKKLKKLLNKKKISSEVVLA